MPAKRIEFVDGFRGAAISLVIVFHAYARWPDLVPYGDAFSDVPLFRNGWLGVELFFMISGFVIVMTLEKCKSFLEFIGKRWLRLFPAMAICSAIIYLSALAIPSLFDARPAGPIALRELLPGLLFVPPDALSSLLHTHVGDMEGSFWSIYVEFKFYILFGLCFFLLGEVASLWIISLLPIAYCLIKLLHFGAADALFNHAAVTYFAWFAIGAILYKIYTGGQRRNLAAVVPLVVSGLYLQSYVGAPIYHNSLDFQAAVFAIVLVAAFVAAIVSNRVQSLFAARALVFVGFVSYPLYLLHENMLIASTIKLHQALPWIPGFLLPLAPIAAIMALAYVIARFGEGPLRSALKPAVEALRSALGDGKFRTAKPQLDAVGT